MFPFLFYAVFKLTQYSVKSIKEVGRLMSVARSPMLNLMGETFNGCSTIRAFAYQKHFIDKNFEVLNKLILAVNINWACWCWFSIRVSIIAVFLLILTATVAILCKNSEDPVYLAMTFKYTLSLTGSILHILGSYGRMESSMVNVERCFKLLDIP